MTAAESVNEEAVELLAQALFRAVGGADWSHDALFFDRERLRRQARDVLADTLPLLRPSDVPHLERRIRESIAGEDVWAEVAAERARAHAKHGDTSMEAQPVDALLRLAILMEEVGEVAKEFNEARHNGTLDLAALRKELIQTAAMAGGWADAIGGSSS